MDRTRYYLSGRDQGDYVEPCGRMRAMEKRLLGKDRLGDLLSVEDVPSVLQRLRRWGWLPAESAGDAPDWDRTVTEGLRRSDGDLTSMDPLPLVTTLLVLRYDLLNLCALLKARSASIPFEGSFHPRGVNTPAVLESMVNRMVFDGYPTSLADELACLAETLVAGGPGEINHTVARALHRTLREGARRQGSRLFTDYFDHLADLVNIKYRLRTLSAPGRWNYDGPLLDGGHLPPPLFEGAGDPGTLRRRLARTVYGPALEKGRGDDGRLESSLFEREADNFLTELIAPARHVSFGPEPLWAYWLARETDGKNVRTIILGLGAGIKRETLWARLRRPYV